MTHPESKERDLIALAKECGARIVYDLPRDLDTPSKPVDVQITPEQLEKLLVAARSLPAADQKAEGEAKGEHRGPIQGEKFMRAWLKLEKLPGTMMIGPEGKFGPIPASTSCWVTTSERERDLMVNRGDPVLEVWVSTQPAEPHPAWCSGGCCNPEDAKDGKPYFAQSQAEQCATLIAELEAESERITRYSNGPGDGLMQAAADMLRALTKPTEQAPARWINADERKPPKNVEVLIAFRDSPLPATGQYTASDRDTWGWSFPAENDPDDCGPITHWMPLPEHPDAALSTATPAQPVEGENGNG